jgi:hypothetical protein
MGGGIEDRCRVPLGVVWSGCHGCFVRVSFGYLLASTCRLLFASASLTSSPARSERSSVAAEACCSGTRGYSPSFATSSLNR